MTSTFHSNTLLHIDEGASITLTSDRIQSFKPGAVFELYSPTETLISVSQKDFPQNNTEDDFPKVVYLGGPISSIDFHASGAHCLASTLQNSKLHQLHIQNTLFEKNYQNLSAQHFTTKLHLFNSLRGTIARQITFESSYIDIARFTHHYNTIIHSGLRYSPSTNTNQISLGYTSLVDGLQLQEFLGHTDKITSITLNPVHDSFVTSSLDSSVRLFDLRSDLTQALIRTPSPNSLSTIDPDGIVVAVATKDNCIKLFDFRALESGPFSSIWLSNIPPVNFTSIKFSPDGTTLIISCSPQQQLEIGVLNDENSTTGQFSTLQAEPQPRNLTTPSPSNLTTITPAIDDTNTDSNASNHSFSAFNYVLIVDAFNGQLLRRIATPRNTFPLDKETLSSINVDEEMILYAPIKAKEGSIGVPNHFGKRIFSGDFGNFGDFGDFGDFGNFGNFGGDLDKKAKMGGNMTNNTHNNNDLNSFTQIQHPIMKNRPVEDGMGSGSGEMAYNVDNINVINPKIFNLPPPNYSTPCSLSTDCKYLSFGTHIGSVPVHDIRSGKQLTAFSHKKQSVIGHTMWNPTRTQLLTADMYELCFWVPAAK
jgi:WD40 repeat protein